MLERIREVAYDSALKKFVLRKEGSGKRIEVPVGGSGVGVGEELYLHSNGTFSVDGDITTRLNTLSGTRPSWLSSNPGDPAVIPNASGLFVFRLYAVLSAANPAAYLVVRPTGGQDSEGRQNASTEASGTEIYMEGSRYLAAGQEVKVRSEFQEATYIEMYMQKAT